MRAGRRSWPDRNGPGPPFTTRPGPAPVCILGHVRPEDSIRFGRIVRVMSEFVRPRRRGPSVPVDSSRLPCARRAGPRRRGLWRPTTDRSPSVDPWGPPWDTTWFRLRGVVPVGVGGAGGGAGLRHRQCRNHRVRRRGPGLARRPAGAGALTQPPRVPGHLHRPRAARPSSSSSRRRPTLPPRSAPTRGRCCSPNPTAPPCSPSNGPTCTSGTPSSTSSGTTSGSWSSC